MRRIPEWNQDDPEALAIAAAMGERRGGELLNLDRALLVSPPLARGWNALFEDVRKNLSLDPLIRELVICAVGGLNGAEYELTQHEPLLLSLGGTPAQYSALASGNPDRYSGALFNPTQTAVLELVVAITRNIQVTDAVFEAVQSALGARQAVELTALTASYNMVSRILVALEVPAES